MSKHTPGPWRRPKADEEYAGACVVREDGYIVADCNVFGGSESPSEMECEANARLIAAAPDLLAACVAIVNAWEADDIGQIDGELIDRASAAIAKAGGGA